MKLDVGQPAFVTDAALTRFEGEAISIPLVFNHGGVFSAIVGGADAAH